MRENPILVDIDNSVMTITLNRPEVKNAANRALAEGMVAALEQLESDPNLRVAIITGAGHSFCTGMDLKAFVSGETPLIKGLGFAGMTQNSIKKPLIAAVEGYAIAGGFEIAITCDLIVAADDAKFGIAEVKRGLVAGAGGLVRLHRQIPIRFAKELAQTGDIITAERAHEMGLINRVVASGSALEGARELAAKIAANGPLAVAASKEVMDKAQDWTTENMWDLQEEITLPIFETEDAIEGSTAFAEKRAPQWKGR